MLPPGDPAAEKTEGRQNEEAESHEIDENVDVSGFIRNIMTILKERPGYPFFCLAAEAQLLIDLAISPNACASLDAEYTMEKVKTGSVSASTYFFGGIIRGRIEFEKYLFSSLPVISLLSATVGPKAHIRSLYTKVIKSNPW